MTFVDGTWLYGNLPRLSELYGQQDFRIDFGKLPQVLARQLRRQVADSEIDVVRTYLFGSYAANYDLRDEETVQRQRDFFDRLREEFHYEVEVYPIDFRGRRLRAADRSPEDPFEPREKCVDISLAATMLYMAAIPSAYDVAMAVLGDRDFTPVLHHVRLLGKRVAIASIRGSCAQELWDARDAGRLKDFDVIWMDDLLQDLELRYVRHRLRCESTFHVGPRDVWTTFHPRPGQKFFCDECRDRFRRQKQVAQEEFVSGEMEAESPAITAARVGDHHHGFVKAKIEDKGYGFLHSRADGHDYFFHLTDLAGDLEFGSLEEGTPVVFDVKKLPTRTLNGTRAGAAQDVRLDVPEPDGSATAADAPASSDAG
jgi:cold shock CspA family protein